MILSVLSFLEILILIEVWFLGIVKWLSVNCKGVLLVGILIIICLVFGFSVVFLFVDFRVKVNDFLFFVIYM